jgi:hypothetical protein
MEKYQTEWNKDKELISALNKIQFNSVIGYGFPDEPNPRACIVVEEGKVTQAGDYQGEELNWDLRAKERHWQDWFNKEVGVTSIGLAWSTGKLKFIEGDYKNMIRNPDYARPFVRSFSVMGRTHASNDEIIN